MSNRSPQIDAYIANAAEYARPILERIRKLYHQACPDIEETIKWGVPHFEYKGIVGGMAAFKHHVGFGFWKEAMLKSSKEALQKTGNATMTSIKIEKLADLPSDKAIAACIKEAVALNEQGVKLPKRKSKKPKVSETPPEDFLAALNKNKKALAAFGAFSPSKKRDYVEWITEAKQQETRQKRIATAVEWIAEGKSRNWKYER